MLLWFVDVCGNCMCIQVLLPSFLLSLFVVCAPLSCSVEDGLPIKGRPFKEGSVIVVPWHLFASCHLVTVTSWDV